MALPRLFHVNRDSQAADAALLAMRLIASLTLFSCSGIPKLFHLSSLLSTGSDPLGVGVLAPAAMIYAAFALGVCPLLVASGVATRYAALFTAISLAGTFFLIDRALPTNLLDPGHNSHPEVIWLFMAAYVALIFTGAGRYSLDNILSASSRDADPHPA